MSSGSWLGHGGADEGIGTKPGMLGPEEKLFLGWLDYTEVERRRQRGSLQARPVAAHERRGTDQAVKVNLPDHDARHGRTSTSPSGDARLVVRSR